MYELSNAFTPTPLQRTEYFTKFGSNLSTALTLPSLMAMKSLISKHWDPYRSLINFLWRFQHTTYFVVEGCAGLVVMSGLLYLFTSLFLFFFFRRRNYVLLSDILEHLRIGRSALFKKARRLDIREMPWSQFMAEIADKPLCVVPKYSPSDSSTQEGVAELVPINYNLRRLLNIRVESVNMTWIIPGSTIPPKNKSRRWWPPVSPLPAVRNKCQAERKIFFRRSPDAAGCVKIEIKSIFRRMEVKLVWLWSLSVTMKQWNCQRTEEVSGNLT